MGGKQGRVSSIKDTWTKPNEGTSIKDTWTKPNEGRIEGGR